MVPAANTQVGWIIDTEGAAGVGGCVLMVAVVTGEIQPDVFLTETL
jgi:hypothetical protein